MTLISALSAVDLSVMCGTFPPLSIEVHSLKCKAVGPFRRGHMWPSPVHDPKDDGRLRGRFVVLSSSSRCRTRPLLNCKLWVRFPPDSAHSPFASAPCSPCYLIQR